MNASTGPASPPPPPPDLRALREAIADHEAATRTLEAVLFPRPVVRSRPEVAS